MRSFVTLAVLEPIPCQLPQTGRSDPMECRVHRDHGTIAQDLLEDRAVPLHILPLEVLEQSPTAAHHLEEAATAVMIQLVALEVLLEPLDPRGQKGNLHGRAPTITLVELVLLDDGILFDRHTGLRRSLRCKGSGFRLTARGAE